MLYKKMKSAGLIFLVLTVSFVMELYPPAVVSAGDLSVPASAPDEKMTPSDLYARYAVLMDADSGRVLFSKSGRTEAPMASTTKIMTCILALENGNPDEIVTVGTDAASQPEVKLGMQEGQRFNLRDLLYSLMLESHNDSAVAIAEQIGESTEDFALMMNEKAAELGCNSTYFITPNGLDAQDETGVHHTTAEDLARMMRYCIMLSPQKDAFLEITGTQSYEFTDLDGTHSYSCTNHNTFLKMMDGALSGKTGFTADAGYCYVGALRRDERTFIVALLACGWPGNKGYKWSDTRKLMEYGIENYQYRTITPDILENQASGQKEEDRDGISQTEGIPVKNGYTGGFPYLRSVTVALNTEGEAVRILLRNDEEIETDRDLPDSLFAPVEKGKLLGTVTYSISGSPVAEYQITAGSTVFKRTFRVCLNYISGQFLF